MPVSDFAGHVGGYDSKAVLPGLPLGEVTRADEVRRLRPFRKSFASGLLDTNERLDNCGVSVINSPPCHPRYHSQRERSICDALAHPRVQCAHCVHDGLASRIQRAIAEPRDDRLRPVLGGRTGREVYRQQHPPLGRRRLRCEVDKREQEIVIQSASRRGRDRALPRAAEDVLSPYALVEWTGDVSHSFLIQAARRF